MKIEPHLFSLRQIIRGNPINKEQISYLIPGYQRPYEWTEKDIDKTVDTLCSAFEKRAAEPILFGTIQLNKVNDTYTAYEIIDGHQRFVTFSLLLRVLNPDNNEPFAKVINQINKDYDKQFEEAGKNDNSNVYNTNYNLLNEKTTEIYDRNDFYNYILDNVVFVAVITSETVSISNTLEIFNSINTTGLPLDTKDIFKISYRDFLVRNNTLRKEEIFEKINNAYLSINQRPHLRENDLLDVMRFQVIASGDTEYFATDLKMSNSAFFEDFFKSSAYNSVMSIDNFTYTAELIKQTDAIISELDKSDYSDLDAYIRVFAKEFLDWSGYSKLNNLLYFFVWCLCREKEDVTDVDVIAALKITTHIWKYCAMYRMEYSKVINSVFNTVGKLMQTFYFDKSIDKLKMPTVDDERCVEDFKITISDNGNVFDSNRSDLLLAISYTEDSYKLGESPDKVKSRLFYFEKWNLDKEHIISHKFNYDYKNVNSIGNLIYLEKNINRSLGSKTSEIDQISSDINNKTSCLDNHTQNYRNSKLDSLNEFLKLYDNNIAKISIEEIVDKRRQEKGEFLLKLFKCVF